MIGLVTIVGVVFVLGHVPMEYATTLEFKKHSFLFKVMYINIASSLYRWRFYSVWIISEGAYIASGVGFNGFNQGKPRWDRVINVDFWGYETSQNIKGVTDKWNIGTSKWLKQCVYQRLTPLGSSPTFAAVFGTYVVSALWHGFYPGYYRKN